MVSVLLPIRVSRVIKFLGTTVLAPLLATLNYLAPPYVVKLKNISYALFLCGNIKANFFLIEVAANSGVSTVSQRLL